MSGRQLMNRSVVLTPGENNIEIRKKDLDTHQGMMIVEINSGIDIQRATAVFID